MITCEPLLSDDRSDTSDRVASSRFVRLLSRVWLFLPLSVRLLVAEVCNLPHRIRAAREISREFFEGLPVVPKGSECFQISGPSSRKRAYSQDMKLLRERFPFLTHLDLSVATLAWKLGTQTNSDTACIETHRRSWQSSLVSQNGSGVCTGA